MNTPMYPPQPPPKNTAIIALLSVLVGMALLANVLLLALIGGLDIQTQQDADWYDTWELVE